MCLGLGGWLPARLWGRAGLSGACGRRRVRSGLRLVGVLRGGRRSRGRTRSRRRRGRTGALGRSRGRRRGWGRAGALGRGRPRGWRWARGWTGGRLRRGRLCRCGLGGGSRGSGRSSRRLGGLPLGSLGLLLELLLQPLKSLRDVLDSLAATTRFRLSRGLVRGHDATSLCVRAALDGRRLADGGSNCSGKVTLSPRTCPTRPARAAGASGTASGERRGTGRRAHRKPARFPGSVSSSVE